MSEQHAIRDGSSLMRSAIMSKLKSRADNSGRISRARIKIHMADGQVILDYRE